METEKEKKKRISDKLNKICVINCKTESGRNKLDSLFSKVMKKVFSYNDSQVEKMTSESLLVILRKLGKKYKLHLSYIFFSVNPEEGLTGSLINRNTPAYEMVCTAYSETLEELFKKIIICIYFFVKENKEEEE